MKNPNEFVSKIYDLPLGTLFFKAVLTHREHFPAAEVQLSSLLSIKTGGCPEDCAYCPQSAHYKTGVKKSPLLDLQTILFAAQNAKANGATRFCMGAAWRSVQNGPEFDRILEAVTAVKNLNLQVCCTLGMLNHEQASRLKAAGAYAYNHNIDTSPSHYQQIISTRQFSDRLATLQAAREAGLTLCTGGILGLGETSDDRKAFVSLLASLNPHPESVTINLLVRTPGTPLENEAEVPWTELLRVICTARICMPKSSIRLSAGRLSLSEQMHFLCFMAGANSIFLGEKLLTSPNPDTSQDLSLLEKLGFAPLQEFSDVTSG